MRGEAGADNSFSRLFPTFTRISLKRNSLGGGSQPRLSDSSPQRPTKEAGERCSSLFPLLCSYNPLPRSVAATDVGHTPIVSADSHVAATGIAVVSIPTTVPIPPVVTIPITTDTRRTNAELAARKHNRVIGRTQGPGKRRKRRETGPEHQN